MSYRAIGLLLATALSGCASVDFDRTLKDTAQQVSPLTPLELSLRQSAQQRTQAQLTTDGLLAQAVTQDAAVQLMLANSPAFQSLLAGTLAQGNALAQRGRLANPVLELERIVHGSERELGRLLSVGLLEILTLPMRQERAKRELTQLQQNLAVQVLERITQVRLAWVRAVTTKQLLSYAHQVNEAAEASAELARRMQNVGNFTKLQRLRQHAFYADSITQLATAKQNVVNSQEALVRTLGLTGAQAQRLVLPARLSDLPQTALAPEQVQRKAIGERLDVALAQTRLRAAAKDQGLTWVESLTDIELGYRRDTIKDVSSATRESRSGWELSLRLPVFDWGDQRRSQMNAQTLDYANQLESTLRHASSQLREQYAAYRTAFDVAKHYRDEVVPLRRQISEENLLRYNGMFIGVFELLADTREQIATVMAAIESAQQFWLAQANLDAQILGGVSGMSGSGMPSGGAAMRTSSPAAH
jgi:outer membrane protein TolC